MKLDNPLLVRCEYASEERLAKRNEVQRSLSQGRTVEDDAVAGVRPTRMVELVPARGLHVQVADAESLPFRDDDLDCVLAAWVPYPVPNLQQALAECARVLRPHGTLVASSVCNDNISEVWELVGVVEPRDTESLRSFVASTIDRAPLPPQAPAIAALRATTRHVVFVAKQPR